MSKLKEIDQRLSEDIAYTDYLTEELKKVPKLNSRGQAASTVAIINRDPSLDALHSKRTIDPLKAFADKDYQRPITLEELDVYIRNRKSSKNFLGSSQKSSISPERKTAAVHAFTCSPPAPLTKVEIQKLTKIEPIKEYKEEWIPMTTWEAFKHWITGGKIKRFEEKK